MSQRGIPLESGVPDTVQMEFPNVSSYRVASVDAGATDGTTELREAWFRHGFALFRVPRGISGCNAVSAAATVLGLGSAHVPSMYRGDPAAFGYTPEGYNRITRSQNKSHRFFGTTSAQGFHTDGTLEPIGSIPVSVLWFERAAVRGGHTTLFQAVRAFENLLEEDPKLARTLTAENALTRTAPSARPSQSATGPAFKNLGDGFRTRWADDGSETWYGTGLTGKQRTRAVAALREMSQPGSPYYVELAIPSGTGLVLRNDVVAHGRTAFFDHPDGENRSLIRGLFTRTITA
jgi:hypothetical protein